ncbi:MAG TPA: tetratricopeptide repeat protein [Pyrinomonadaceae bacterium]|nr:tetratricopeptide repeat protein [Pyrinomonadaceae bacterium]
MTAKVSVLVLLFLGVIFFAQNITVQAQISNQTASQTTQEDNLESHISAAETYQISGDLVNAQIENRAIAAIGLRRFGNISLEEGKNQEAIKMLSDSKEYVDNNKIRLDLAIAYMQENETDKALAEAQTAVNLDPKDGYARYILGNIYFTKENYVAALPELEKVLLLAPNFDAARALGLTYLYLKQLERAKLLFEEIQTTIKKDNAELHILFGQAYEQTNYPLEAEREFKRALAINPKQERASFFLGYVILQYGGSERFTEAQAAFEKELEITPNDFFANFFAGVAASSANDHKKALGLLQKAVELNPQSSEANLFLGQSQMETGDLKAAEKTFRRALELTTNASKNGFEARRTHYMLGRLLIQDGRREEGEAELIKARELQTELIKTTRDDLSQLFSQVVSNTKKTPLKGKTQNQEVKLPPQRIAELNKIKMYLSVVLAQAFFNLGVISFQGNNLSDALENFSKASTWKPDFPNLDRTLGIVAFRSGQYKQVTAPLARHIKTNPQDNLARQMLGASYYFTKNFKDAVETLKPLEAVITDDGELAYFYGVSLIQLERNQEAVPVFDKLAKISQKSPETLANAAQGFMLMGDYERAAKEFRATSVLAPQKEKINFFIGQCLIRLNRFDEAEKAFQQELSINPYDESAKYHLALTLIERKIKPDETIQFLNEAIALRSDYADAHYQLGKIYIEKGETEKAIEHLEAAANADQKKDYIHYQLSIAYRKASRKADADRELKLYQELKAANRKIDSLMPMGSKENVPQ